MISQSCLISQIRENYYSKACIEDYISHLQSFITETKASPFGPLANQHPGPPSKAFHLADKEVNSHSSKELLKQPLPDFYYMNVRSLKEHPYATFFKIESYSDVITVRERNYIKEADQDEE